MPSNAPPRWILAAYYWSPYLTLAVLNGTHVVELACHRVSARKRTTATLHAHFHKLAQEYQPDCIVIPPVTALYEASILTGCAVETISLSAAKKMLCGQKHRATYRDLYPELLRRCPQLKPYIPNLTGGRSDDAKSRSYSTIQLLPVALGLAAVTVSPEKNNSLPQP